MSDIVTYEHDGVVYATKPLACNSTLAALRGENEKLFKLYRKIETLMEQKFEPFSVVYDDGILITCKAEDFVGFIMNICDEPDAVTITTTGDREFRLTTQKSTSPRGPFSRLLKACPIHDGEFTNVFVDKSNTVTVNSHVIAAYITEDFLDITVCDGIKRFGFMVAYTDTAYLIFNEGKTFLFLFDHPECDVSSQFRSIGSFWIKDKTILFRTDYGYSVAQDFIVRDIQVTKDLAVVVCSTEANPDIKFILEV